ncbi:MAG: hypothetical protein ABI905_17675, partial [Betaproteobacteria bacterium]
PDWAKASISVFPSGHVISEFKRETKNIGAGDMAYVVGVFKMLMGNQKNVPFVHTGHIASMADGETVRTEDWTDKRKSKDSSRRTISIHGYMVQVNTLERSSGSPVFVRRSLESKNHFLERDDSSAHLVKSWQYGSVWLLGLWHGAFESGLKDVDLNVGMGICVPATRIMEVLDGKELTEMRKQADEKTQEKTVVKLQRGKTKSLSGDDILKRMLATPPDPKAKKSAGT